MKLQLRDQAKWTSSAAGTTKEKVGTVVAVVMPGVNPMDKFRALSDARWNKKLYDFMCSAK